MQDITEFTRIFLALFFSFVATFYVVRIIVVKSAIASEVVFVGEKYTKEWCNQLTFRLFRTCICCVCLLRLAYPTIDSYLGMITSLVSPIFQFLGMLLLGLGLGFTATSVIHFKLGELWRSGIDLTHLPRS